MGLSDSFCNINQCITYDPYALFNDRSLFGIVFLFQVSFFMQHQMSPSQLELLKKFFHEEHSLNKEIEMMQSDGEYMGDFAFMCTSLFFSHPCKVTFTCDLYKMANKYCAMSDSLSLCYRLTTMVFSAVHRCTRKIKTADLCCLHTTKPRLLRKPPMLMFPLRIRRRSSS